MASGSNCFGNGFFFIATNGSDTNTGTIIKPFATLKRAWDAATNLKKTKPIDIILRKGI